MRKETLASHSGGRGGRGETSVEIRELEERLEVLYQENQVLTEQQTESSDELDRLRQDKIRHVHDHMALVRQIGALRDELTMLSAREKRAGEGRDRAHLELQRCVEELLRAQEHTEQAMAIAQRHASERDEAMSAVNEHRLQLEQMSAWTVREREGLLTDLATVRTSERGASEQLSQLKVGYQVTNGPFP